MILTINYEMYNDKIISRKKVFIMEMKTKIPEAALSSLEPLYNHKTICDTLLHSGTSSAITQFRLQADCLKNIQENYLPQLRCIFLNSLNRSLYNYILYLWNISLSECCFQNKTLSHHFESHKDFLKAGEEIIYSYSSYIPIKVENSSHISKACTYIEEHLQEDLSLNIVANYIYVNKYYLCKTFKLFTGKTFSCYVNERRLIRARNLLLTTNFSIDHIAELCGFHSSTYFSTTFRKGTGISPLEFRRQYQTY